MTLLRGWAVSNLPDEETARYGLTIPDDEEALRFGESMPKSEEDIRYGETIGNDMEERPQRDYHPSEILRYFHYEHLLPHLAAVSKPFCDLAEELDRNLPDGEEKKAALRKLLESKDAAVRTLV